MAYALRASGRTKPKLTEPVPEPGPHSTNLSSYKGIRAVNNTFSSKPTFGRSLKTYKHDNGVPGAKYKAKPSFGPDSDPGSLKYPPRWDRPDVRDYLGPRLANGRVRGRPRATTAFGAGSARSRAHVMSQDDFVAPGKHVGIFHVGTIAHDNPAPPVERPTSWNKAKRQGLEDFMNKGGAAAQHGAQLVSKDTPGPIYNVKAPPVNSFKASIGGGTRFKDTVADIPQHIRRRIAAKTQATERKFKRERDKQAQRQQSRPSSAPAWRRKGRQRAAKGKPSRRDSATSGTTRNASSQQSNHPIMEQARELEEYLKSEAAKEEAAAADAAAVQSKAEEHLLSKAKRVVGLGGIDVGGPAGSGPPVSMWDTVPPPVHPQTIRSIRRQAKHAVTGRRKRSGAHFGGKSRLSRARRPSFLENLQKLGHIHDINDSPAHEYNVAGINRYDFITPTFNAKLATSNSTTAVSRIPRKAMVTAKTSSTRASSAPAVRRSASAKGASSRRKSQASSGSSDTGGGGGNPKAGIERLLRWRPPELLVFDLDTEVQGLPTPKSSNVDSEHDDLDGGGTTSTASTSPKRAVVAFVPAAQALAAPPRTRRRRRKRAALSSTAPASGGIGPGLPGRSPYRRRSGYVSAAQRTRMARTARARARARSAPRHRRIPSSRRNIDYGSTQPPRRAFSGSDDGSSEAYTYVDSTAGSSVGGGCDGDGSGAFAHASQNLHEDEADVSASPTAGNFSTDNNEPVVASTIASMPSSNVDGGNSAQFVPMSSGVPASAPSITSVATHSTLDTYASDFGAGANRPAAQSSAASGAYSDDFSAASPPAPRPSVGLAAASRDTSGSAAYSDDFAPSGGGAPTTVTAASGQYSDDFDDDGKSEEGVEDGDDDEYGDDDFEAET